jgi:hypothetical protein
MFGDMIWQKTVSWSSSISVYLSSPGLNLHFVEECFSLAYELN